MNSLDKNESKESMTSAGTIDSHKNAFPATERTTAFSARLKFSGSNEFQAELRRRIDDFFNATGRKERDCWQMYLKSAVLLAILAGLYVLLVFAAASWWQTVPLAILLGLASAAIGFNVQHDGGHEAYSRRKWINKIAAMTLDLIGGSSYLWHWKHVIFHHTYTNITGKDTDIELGALGRLSPHQRRFWFHRWQHIYLWPLYGLIAIKWQLVDDFREIITGRTGSQPIPRPKGWDLVVLIAGKTIFLGLAFALPMMFHPVLTVLFFYALAMIVNGMVLSVVFQMAHCVEGALFPLPHAETGLIENAWAIHEVESTVDFARRSRIVAWLLGGLNFQIEHHLFSRICHVNYPAMAAVVEATCRDFGVGYREHPSFLAGLASHYRWLREMGASKPVTAQGQDRAPASKAAMNHGMA